MVGSTSGDGGPKAEGAAERIVVAFGPGVDRTGLLVARDGAPGTTPDSSQDSHWFDVQFPPRERQALAIGALVLAWRNTGRGAPTQEQHATVVARSESRTGRRYRFLLQQRERREAPPPPPPPDSPLHSPPIPLRPTTVELRFGTLKFPAEITAAFVEGLRLAVSLTIERQLRSADALELVVTRPPAPASIGELRLVGWVVHRVLDRGRVAYDFRIDDQLTDDCVRQRLRLQALLAPDARESST